MLQNNTRGVADKSIRMAKVAPGKVNRFLSNVRSA